MLRNCNALVCCKKRAERVKNRKIELKCQKETFQTTIKLEAESFTLKSADSLENMLQAIKFHRKVCEPLKRCFA